MENNSILIKPHCPNCKHKTLQSLSIKCMYCGEILPEKHRPSNETRRMVIERNVKINDAHDLAMEAKLAKGKKKKGQPKPPNEII